MNNKSTNFQDSEAKELEKSYRLDDIVKQRQKTLATLDLKSGERVLDIGCGVGFLAYEMAIQVRELGLVICLDQNQEMISHAKQLCKNVRQTEFYEGDAGKLPVEDHSLDAVSCTQVLLYVENVSLVLTEIKRVLKPGGRVVIVETDWRGVILNSADGSLTQQIFSAWDTTVPSPNLPVHLRPLLKKHGFSKIQVEAIPILNTGYSPSNFSHGVIKWIAKNAEKKGVISKEQTKDWLTDFEKLEKEDSYFFCVNRFLFSAFLK